MADIFSALKSSANALVVFQRGLTVIGNNVSNASTPGYARQSFSPTALPFDPNAGLPGGISAGEIQSARDEYAEQTVREQASQVGTLEQKAQSLSSLELNFNVSSDSGVPGALNGLFQSFSSWGVTPNSSASRQAVIDNAKQVAQAFQAASANFSKASNDVDVQLNQTVQHINALTAQLQKYNVEKQSGSSDKAGLDAQIHSTLED